jgi:two-component system response regulator
MTSNTQATRQPEQRPATPDWHEDRHPLVLIVEDHDDTREMLQILLSAYGCHVIGAENGQEALDLAEQLHPDLILLDMKLPILDGLTVARIVRSHPTLNHVPIIGVTGMATPQFEREVLAAGCDYFLAKPFDFAQLKKLIKTLTHSMSQSAKASGSSSFAVRSKGVLCSGQHLH